MKEHKVQEVNEAKTRTGLRLRVDTLLERAELVGLTPDVHHHCMNIFSKDVYSIDSAQLHQLETTFGYFCNVLTGHARKGEIVH